MTKKWIPDESPKFLPLSSSPGVRRHIDYVAIHNGHAVGYTGDGQVMCVLYIADGDPHYHLYRLTTKLEQFAFEDHGQVEWNRMTWDDFLYYMKKHDYYIGD